jgi:hypothetical protein
MARAARGVARGCNQRLQRKLSTDSPAFTGAVPLGITVTVALADSPAALAQPVPHSVGDAAGG